MWQKIKNIYHLGQAVEANVYYKFPAKKLTVIGVTGTDGKTTTASLIHHILKSAGKKAALISTVGAFIGDRVYDVGFHVTNPASWALQKFIRQVVDEGNEYLVLEVTSHGLDQNRVWGIPFAISAITNVTHEHLDYHGTYGNYLATKAKLLTASKVAVMNLDDSSYGKIRTLTAKKIKKIRTYSRTRQDADYSPKKFPFTTSLLGDFNISNSLAAIAVTRELGIAAEDIRNALRSFKPPQGRQEVVYDRIFRVIIDFAHTPNSFAQILPPVRNITIGRLIHVFGSAGKRDQTKRPLMGKEAGKFDDSIILTAEDPRDEPTEKICREIAEGLGDNWVRVGEAESQRVGELENRKSKTNPPPGGRKSKQYFIIPDRKEAIRLAIAQAEAGDTVILTGKAHEKSMNYGKGEEPWDEFAEVRKALEVKG